MRANDSRALCRTVNGSGVAPMVTRNFVDQNVGLPGGRQLFHAYDDVVDALDDLAALIRRQRAFRDIDLGNRHGDYSFAREMPSEAMPIYTRCQARRPYLKERDYGETGSGGCISACAA